MYDNSTVAQVKKGIKVVTFYIKNKETPIIGKMGWAVNSIVYTFKSSNLLFPNVVKAFIAKRYLLLMALIHCCLM